MTQNFDKLIASAAPVVPNAGPSRRVARALLHERMRGHQRQRRTRNRWGLSLAASLAFGLMFMGQVGNLGSDSFELEIQPDHVDLGQGEFVQVLSSKVRGPVGATVPGFDESDYRELQAKTILGEGAIESLSGYAFGDATPEWTIAIKRNINGRIITESMLPQDLSVPSEPPGRDKIPFFIGPINEFIDQMDSGEIPARPGGVVSANGIQFQILTYTRTYPEWGRFTYYRGYPLKPYSFSR